jgi:hypothetical protein
VPKTRATWSYASGPSAWTTHEASTLFRQDAIAKVLRRLPRLNGSPIGHQHRGERRRRPIHCGAAAVTKFHPPGVFCGTTGSLSTEHGVPKWCATALQVREPVREFSVTRYVASGSRSRRHHTRPDESPMGPEHRNPRRFADVYSGIPMHQGGRGSAATSEAGEENSTTNSRKCPDPAGQHRTRTRSTPGRIHAGRGCSHGWWQVMGSNHRGLSRRFYREPASVATDGR